MAANEITAELAQKALRVEAANVLKKLQGGKTLTAAERALIQSIANGGNPADARAWAKSKVALAQALGTTRQTIDRWVKLKRNGPPRPESNGRWNIADWKRWMKETGRGGGLAGDTLEDELPRLNAKRLLLINERLELDNAERRGDLISRDDVVRESAEIATRLRGDLYGLGGSICAEVMKMADLDEAVSVYNSAVDRVLASISRGLKSARQRRREDVDEELEDATFEEVGNDGAGR
jgi:hypothetical protein